MKQPESIISKSLTSGSLLVVICGVWLVLSVPLVVNADSPQLQTPAPVIYLADNLDEKMEVNQRWPDVEANFRSRIDICHW